MNNKPNNKNHIEEMNNNENKIYDIIITKDVLDKN